MDTALATHWSAGSDRGAAAENAALERIAREVLEATGVAVVFYRPDGTPVSGSGEFQDDLARLVRQAAESDEDRFERAGEQLRAAWPVRRRGRTVLVAAAEAPASGDGDVADRLLAALGCAVRARLDLEAAHRGNEAISEALCQSFEEVSLLHGLGEMLRVTQPVSELLECACRELCETIGAEATAAYIPATGNMEPETVVAGRLPFDESQLPRLMDHVLDTLGSERPVLINNYCQDDPALAKVSVALERLILVPLPLREGVSGAVAAFNRPGGEFGSPDAKLTRSVASSTAVFVENHRLYRELRELMLDLVRALVSSIDAKDPYTSGHSERVAMTSREIARRMNLPDEQVERVYMAGLLHDIGKIGTPEHILQKEGRLEPEERRIVNEHPVVGGHILEAVERLEPIREAVLYHHERLDGSGYPEGMKGDRIPLLARILGLADAFDAMTSNRPYRPMMPLDEVKQEIKRNVGTQFDVRVVDALFSFDLDRLMRMFAERSTLCTQLV